MLKSVTILTTLLLATVVVQAQEDPKWDVCTKGKGQEAVDACTSFIGVNAPHNLAALLNRASQYHNMKNYRDALYDYDEAIRLKPDVHGVFLLPCGWWAKRFTSEVTSFHFEPFRCALMRPDVLNHCVTVSQFGYGHLTSTR